MNTARDTILVIGPSASGKTRILNLLRTEMARYNIPFERKPISDSHTIMARMLKDDAEGGFGHYHNWCPGNTDGHTHNNGEPIVPFTLTGNGIPHAMMTDFFRLLADHPNDGYTLFAEWSGGVNINDASEPAAKTDLSFETIGRMLKTGQLPKEGLNRVMAVIHPVTPDEVRLALNSNRGLPTPEDEEFGLASWPLSDTGMKIFGHDDSGVLADLFNESGIPHVYHLYNDGNNSLKEGLDTILPAVLETWCGGETGHPSRREREF